MTGHPIIFNSEMVRAILDGRKTQTRRIVKAKPPKYFNVTNIEWLENTKLLKKRREFVKVYSPGWYWIDNDAPCGAISGPFKCPYGKPGDLLWVKEAFDIVLGAHGESIEYIYKADHDASVAQWQSPLYMPKRAARIWLKVTDVRVERVQDISEEDAQAEGCKNDVLVSLDGGDYIGLYARERFEDLWDSINKKRGYGWDSNPWVWVIEFERADNGHN